jgi:hypothetical protein
MAMNPDDQIGPDKGTGKGTTKNPAEDWYNSVIAAQPDKYDTSIPKDVWISWFPLWDQGSQSFKSQKLDANGQPITGTGFGKPTDCPSGTLAYGENQCLPANDRRIVGMGGGGGDPTAATPATPAAPPKPLTLQDMLNAMFQQKAGLFGYQQGRTPYAQQFQGLFGVDQYGNKLPNAPDLTSKSLSGGGLIWGPAGTDLTGFGGGTTQPTTQNNTNPNLVNALSNNNTNWINNPQPGLVNALNKGGSTQPFNMMNINRAQPANVFPTQGGGATSLSDVLNGTNMFGKKPKTSPLSQIFQGF